MCKISPWTKLDIETVTQEKCKGRDLLEAFVARCRDKGDQTDNNMLLETCLTAVLPMCNDNKPDSIRSYLKNYCDATDHESSSYASTLFSRTFNCALEKLERLTLPLRAPSELHILFDRDESSFVFGKYPNPDPSLCKFDPVIAPLVAAGQSDQPIKYCKDRDSVIIHAPEPPTTDFIRWESLSLEEHKGSFDAPESYNTTFHGFVHTQQYDSSLNARAEASGKSTHQLYVISPPIQALNLGRTKRKYDASDRCSSEGRKSSVQSNGNVQCVQPDTEMLSLEPYTTHSIILFIQGTVAWIWWCDRQGAIKSSPMDFVRDLPYFLVLLASFQRFTVSDWGLDEAGIRNNDTEAYIPDIICSRDSCAAAGTRKDLDIVDSGVMEGKGHRVLRLISPRRLQPIQELGGFQFMNVWRDCYRCHFRLWLNEMEHGDISVSNLMFDPISKAGVLISLDLPFVRHKGKPRLPSDKESIASTFPFMSMDLLCDEFFEGKTRRLYRHENESFIWVLAWQLLKDDLVQEWDTRYYDICRIEKNDSISDPSRLLKSLKPTAGPAISTILMGLLLWLKTERNKRSDRADSAVYASLRRQAKIAGHSTKKLDLLQDESSLEAARRHFMAFERIIQDDWTGFTPLSKEETQHLCH